jgi:hypothetical protein
MTRLARTPAYRHITVRTHALVRRLYALTDGLSVRWKIPDGMSTSALAAADTCACVWPRFCATNLPVPTLRGVQARGPSEC